MMHGCQADRTTWEGEDERKSKKVPSLFKTPWSHCSQKRGTRHANQPTGTNLYIKISPELDHHADAFFWWSGCKKDMMESEKRWLYSAKHCRKGEEGNWGKESRWKQVFLIAKGNTSSSIRNDFSLLQEVKSKTKRPRRDEEGMDDDLQAKGVKGLLNRTRGDSLSTIEKTNSKRFQSPDVWSPFWNPFDRSSKRSRRGQAAGTIISCPWHFVSHRSPQLPWDDEDFVRRKGTRKCLGEDWKRRCLLLWLPSHSFSWETARVFVCCLLCVVCTVCLGGRRKRFFL